MYCPKCGKKLPKNATLCVTCDQDKIKEYLENNAKEEPTTEETNENTSVEEKAVNESVSVEEETTIDKVNDETTTEQEKINENNTPAVEESKVDKTPTKDNVPVEEPKPTKSKKILKKILISFIICVVLAAIVIVGGLIAYKKMGGSIKLSWNENYSDYELDYIMPNKIKLGFDISDESKIDKVKIKTTCGSYEKPNSGEIIWDLTEASGDCKIEVSYKLKKISKKIEIISLEKEIAKDFSEDTETEKIDYDSDEDLDYDGLTNKEEKKYKTNPELADTDMDGLEDEYEVNTSKTNPTKVDSDGDGLSDYDELELDLNPLKDDSKGDGIKDGKRELTYDYENDDVKIVIKGKGNIASIIADIYTNTKISGKKGLVDKLYLLHTEGTITEATLTINYTDEELAKYGLKEDNLSIFYYNEKEAKYEKIDTVIDKENKTLTAKLKHFSPYVYGDSEQLNEQATYQVLFVLDNSWSMYTNEQYKKITGEEYSGGWFDTSDLAGNDADGVRFTLTSELVDKLAGKNYQIGVSEFRKDYANVLPIGSKDADIKKKLPKMNGKFVTKVAGTNTSRAIVEGLDEFSDDTDYKYIIILTDGHDTETSYKTDEVIKRAKENNVKVCSIGFGEGATNVNLANISNATGCKFYASSDAMGLEELFSDVQTELNEDLIDLDGDGNNDGILIADSGFIVNRDGFSFANYPTNKDSGHCFGMATFAELYYKKQLPLKANSKTVGSQELKSYNLTYSYFKNYSNLYDYRLQSDALKYYGYMGYKGFNNTGEDNPADLYDRVENKTLMYSNKYKKEIDDYKIYDIKSTKTTISKSEQKSKYKASYKKYQTVLLNEDSMQNSNLKHEDLQLLNALYYLLRKQDDTTLYSSAYSAGYAVRGAATGMDTQFVGVEGFLNILISRLKDQDPAVLSINGHAVNAIDLYQDINDSSIYHIGIYDNNYPGEKRYISMKCKKNKCLTIDNDYYKIKGNKIRITPSLEQDLEYFK